MLVGLITTILVEQFTIIVPASSTKTVVKMVLGVILVVLSFAKFVTRKGMMLFTAIIDSITHTNQLMFLKPLLP